MEHHALIKQQYQNITIYIPLTVSSINLFPEKRKELATIALGSKAEQEIGYYASLHQKAEDESIIHDIPIEGNDSNADFSSNAWKVVKEDGKDQDDKQVTSTPGPVKDTSNALAINHNLTAIMKDLQQCLEQDTSGQLKQGVEKFCQRYQQMSMLKFSNNRIVWLYRCNTINSN